MIQPAWGQRKKGGDMDFVNRDDCCDGKMVSIIVPVYNVEKYLAKCLDSIVSQTYRNIEIVLINDGSTDQSLAICTSYAKADDRIQVITKENEGAAIARNVGLDLAKGAYIFFVDSDDAIQPNMVEVLVKNAEWNHADVCVCGYKKNGQDCLIDNLGETELIADRSALGKALILQRRIGVMPWGKLYKKECIGNIRFVSGRTNEDDLFCHQVFARCQTVVKVNLPLYLYTVNQAGVTYGGFSIRQIDILAIAWKRLEEVEKVWPEYLDSAMYVAACSFIDLHVAYAIRHLWNDDCFTKKLLADREELFHFLIRNRERLDKEIRIKIEFYYTHMGKIMFRDRLRCMRNAGINFAKSYVHRLRIGCEISDESL